MFTRMEINACMHAELEEVKMASAYDNSSSQEKDWKWIELNRQKSRHLPLNV